MLMNWRDKTCEKCVFRVGDECRRFPPAATSQPIYPSVKYMSSIQTHPAKLNYSFSPACAEYSEDGNTEEDAFRQLAEAAKRLREIRNKK